MPIPSIIASKRGRRPLKADSAEQRAANTLLVHFLFYTAAAAAGTFTRWNGSETRATPERWLTSCRLPVLLSGCLYVAQKSAERASA